MPFSIAKADAFGSGDSPKRLSASGILLAAGPRSADSRPMASKKSESVTIIREVAVWRTVSGDVWAKIWFPMACRMKRRAKDSGRPLLEAISL